MKTITYTVFSSCLAQILPILLLTSEPLTGSVGDESRSRAGRSVDISCCAKATSRCRAAFGGDPPHQAGRNEGRAQIYRSLSVQDKRKNLKKQDRSRVRSGRLVERAGKSGRVFNREWLLAGFRPISCFVESGAASEERKRWGGVRGGNDDDRW